MAKNTRHTMKKFFFSLLLLIASIGAINAQSSAMATLSHNGKITVFYGKGALSEAHSAAKPGDIISLSSGTFTATDITKAITLRGAGCEEDTVRNIIPTRIEGDFTINVTYTTSSNTSNSEGSGNGSLGFDDVDSIANYSISTYGVGGITSQTTHRLTIEGIYCNDKIFIKGVLNNAAFIKNIFNNYVSYYDTSTSASKSYTNNSFVQCRFTKEFWGPYSFTKASSYSFVNCIFENGIANEGVSSTFTNCIIFHGTYRIGYSDYTYLSNIKYAALYNCILVGNNTNSYNYIGATSYATNCVAINTQNVLKNFYTNSSSTNRLCATADLFGTAGAVYPYKLTDTAKTKYLGKDGKEVGIYGGSFPYNTTVANPYIVKCNVAPYSTNDGKLSIEIEIKSAE